ncbi:MAG: zinc ABC transporter substrate-binding protein [Desulfovibrio sp.]|nr:zinc ABC transporter substrate-binding protein [Desulfovibrio sp.]MBI4961270.1 zinc ABC transporter substrate-binding protein [Desulfovibrio sp.]
MTSLVRFGVLLLCLAAGPALADAPVPVMAGTTLVEDILTGLGGKDVAVKTVIPGAACPGHYDVKTSDVAFLARASVILLHDWQERMPALVSIIDAVPGAKQKVRVLKAKGNWMVPERQAEAAMEIAEVLQELAPGRAGRYAEAVRGRLASIQAVAEREKERIRSAGLAGAPVICDVMQRPLVEFLGFRVVADYGRFEEMGPEALGRTITAAKLSGAKLVLDNLQSTGAAGKSLAEDIGAGHATLTNFPGGFPGADTWEDAVSRNVDLILAAGK